jgi:heptosyltransferase-2
MNCSTQVNNIHKILIVRFSSIGDIVITSAVVRCLRLKYPNAQIHYLTKASFTCLVKQNPYIDKIQKLDNSLIAVASSLRKEKYDLVVDLHKNLRTKILLLMLGVQSVDYDKLNLQKWLTVKTGKNFLPDNHIVKRYFDGLKKFNVKYDDQGLDFFYSPESKDFVEDILQKEGINSDFLCVTMGAKFATKALPVEKLKSILTNIDSDIVLIGGNEDRAKAIELKTLLPEKNIFNACGRFTIEQSAVIVDKSSVVLANDTGFMHIAAAFKKPLISVWGSTVPKLGLYPFYPKHKQYLFEIEEVEGLKCRPCSKLGFDKCPKGHFKCMNLLNEKRIVSLIKKSIPKR